MTVPDHPQERPPERPAPDPGNADPGDFTEPMELDAVENARALLAQEFGGPSWR